MPLTVSEDEVFDFIPSDVKRPADVPAMGRGGVTAATYNRLGEIAKNEILTRLELMEADTEDSFNHTLVKAATAMLTAARVLRTLRVYQEVADSLFADANINMRLFFEGTLGLAEDGTIGASIVIEEDDTPVARKPWLPNSNDLVDGFRLNQDYKRK